MPLFLARRVLRSTSTVKTLKRKPTPPAKISFVPGTNTTMLNAIRRLHTARQSLPKTIKAILNEKVPAETTVSINGWIRSVRSQKNVSFANVNDGSNLKGIQAILNSDQAKR
jgi:hypothetical protein